MCVFYMMFYTDYKGNLVDRYCWTDKRKMFNWELDLPVPKGNQQTFFQLHLNQKKKILSFNSFFSETIPENNDNLDGVHLRLPKYELLQRIETLLIKIVMTAYTVLSIFCFLFYLNSFTTVSFINYVLSVLYNFIAFYSIGSNLLFVYDFGKKKS